MDTHHGHSVSHIGHGQLGQMAIFGHLATFGHGQYDPNYVHDGYPRKEHEKTNSPVKVSSDLDVWLKNYDQNKDFGFSPYVSLLCKTKMLWPIFNCHAKILKLCM